MNTRILDQALSRARWRLIPFLMLLYFMSFLNRVNTGFAGLPIVPDVGIGPAMFGLGAGIFAIGYCLLKSPPISSGLRWVRAGGSRASWRHGVWSPCRSPWWKGPYRFAGLRFLLGVAEAGFFPGIILYLTFSFPARHRAGVIAIFMAAAPISNALEALPTVLPGFVVFSRCCPIDRGWRSGCRTKNARPSKMRSKLKTAPSRHLGALDPQ